MSRFRFARRADSAAFAVDVILRDVTAAMREQIAEFLSDLQARLQDHAPVATGRFRGSIHPWRTEPGDWVPPESAAGSYTLAGDPDIDRVMANWLPGVPVGLVSNVPYANRLANGWSQKAPAGWVETEIAGAIASASRRAA